MMDLLRDFYQDLKDGDPLPWLILATLLLLVAGGIYVMTTLPADEKGEWITSVGVAFLIGWLIAGRR